MHVHRGVIYAYFLPIGSKAGSRPPAQLILSRDGVGPAQGAPNLPKYWRDNCDAQSGHDRQYDDVMEYSLTSPVP